jgi:hypothetical protein
MVRNRERAFSLIIGLAMLAGVARAETVRAPQTGSPAFVIDVPADWTAKDGGDAVSIAPEGGGVLLTLAVFPTDSSCNQIAAEEMKYLSVEPSSVSAPGAIWGHAGTVYAARVPGSNTLTVRVACARIDAAHAAVELEAPDTTASADQVRRLRELAATARLEGVR